MITAAFLHPPTRRPRGFTLVEVMIVVAVIAILSAIAIPSYRDYIIRGRLTDATNGLTTMRAEMERYFQDNRTYASVSAAIVSPCLRPAAQRTFGDFVVTCSAGPAAATYTLSVDGTAASSMAGFGFTTTEADVRATTTTAAAGGGGWTVSGANTCWVVKKGQTC